MAIVTGMKFDQYRMAEDLLFEIKQDIDYLKELTPLVLLDMMGIVGISFTVGDDASLAFFEALVPGCTTRGK